MNDALKAIRERRSVRKYKSDAVPQAAERKADRVYSIDAD